MSPMALVLGVTGGEFIIACRQILKVLPGRYPDGEMKKLVANSPTK
jgi:hypothetical protein